MFGCEEVKGTVSLAVPHNEFRVVGGRLGAKFLVGASCQLYREVAWRIFAAGAGPSASKYFGAWIEIGKSRNLP